VLLMDFSISSKRNVSAFQATFFEMLNAWSASCFPDMTRISRGMNQRACKDCAVAFVTHFQPRTGLVEESPSATRSWTDRLSLDQRAIRGTFSPASSYFLSTVTFSTNGAGSDASQAGRTGAYASILAGKQLLSSS